MRIGSAIKAGLSSIGVTSERVTSLGQSVGLLQPGQDCGCTGRAQRLDTIHESAIRWLSPRLGIRSTPETPIAVADSRVRLPCGEWLNGDRLDPEQLTDQQRAEIEAVGVYCSDPALVAAFRAHSVAVVKGC